MLAPTDQTMVVMATLMAVGVAKPMVAAVAVLTVAERAMARVV